MLARVMGKLDFQYCGTTVGSRKFTEVHGLALLRPSQVGCSSFEQTP